MQTTSYYQCDLQTTLLKINTAIGSASALTDLSVCPSVSNLGKVTPFGIILTDSVVNALNNQNGTSISGFECTVTQVSVNSQNGVCSYVIEIPDYGILVACNLSIGTADTSTVTTVTSTIESLLTTATANGFSAVNNGGTGAGFAGIDITNLLDVGRIIDTLGYTPLANTAAAISAVLGYTPMANTVLGITTALGYTPIGSITSTAIEAALGFTPAANTPAAIEAALGYTPLASITNGDITTALGFTPVANTATAIEGALGYTPLDTVTGSDVVTALGYTPVPNTAAGIETALGYTPLGTVTSSDVTAALGFTPLADTAAAIASALGYTPVANTPTGIETALGYTPVNNNMADTWTVYSDLFMDSVLSGIVPSYTGLTLTLSPGVGYIIGQRVIYPGGNYVVGASTSTYFAMSNTGVMTATTAQTLPANSMWLYKIVSNTTSITGAYPMFTYGITINKSITTFGPTYVPHAYAAGEALALGQAQSLFATINGLSTQPFAASFFSAPNTTSLAGTTAGSITWSQYFQKGYNAFTAQALAYENDTTIDQTITFPTPFVNVPEIVYNNSGLTVTATTTTLTITAPNSTTLFTGIIKVEGF